MVVMVVCMGRRWRLVVVLYALPPTLFELYGMVEPFCEGVQKRPRSGRPATNGLVPETWESREKMHLAAPVGRLSSHPLT